MRSRGVSRRKLAGGGVVLLIAIVIGVSLAPDLRADAPAPPSVLNRIARNNDHAAAEAAARMRTQSQASATAADNLRAAQERGRVKADAALARYDNEEPAR